MVSSRNQAREEDESGINAAYARTLGRTISRELGAAAWTSRHKSPCAPWSPGSRARWEVFKAKAEVG